MDVFQLKCTSPCPYCYGSAKINRVTLSKDEILLYDYICDCGYIHKKSIPLTYLGAIPPIDEKDSMPHMCLKCPSLMIQGNLQGDGSIEYTPDIMSCARGHFTSVSTFPIRLPKECTY